MNQWSKELMHHGVIGMKWGVRRYQPYGHGGYNAEHKGKFIGDISKKQQKRIYKDLKKASKAGVSTKRARDKFRYDSDIRKDLSDNKSLQKAREDNTNAFSDYMDAHYLWRAHQDDKGITAHLESAFEKWGKASEKEKKAYQKIAKDILGEYADMEIKNISGTSTAKDVLVDYLRYNR